MNRIDRICPCCGQGHTVNLTDDQVVRYKRFLNREGNIQVLLPDLSAENRELLITGICSKCWSEIVGEE